MKTAMKSAKRVLALALMVICVVSILIIPACAEPSTEELIRYIPVSYTVTDDTIVVDGYFVNMNKKAYVSDFKDFEMRVYENDEELFSGTFGDLHSFMINPRSVYHETLTIHYTYGTPLMPGTYDCGDDVYASFTCGCIIWQ